MSSFVEPAAKKASTGPTGAVDEKYAQYYEANDLAVAQLKAKEAYDGLTEKEKRYAAHIGRASWEGAKICLLQTSSESVPAFLLLLEVFADGAEALKAAVVPRAVATEEDFTSFVTFAGVFLSNMGARIQNVGRRP